MLTSGKIAIVTCNDWPELTPDDQLWLRSLKKHGIQFEIKKWNDTSVRWGAYDAVVIRSTWDYAQKINEFQLWLDELNRQQAVVWNPVSVLKKNINKLYLKNLAELGLPIVPTLWVNLAQIAESDKQAADKGWSDLVIKPAVGAGGFQTLRVDTTRENLSSRLQPLLLEDSDWAMVQPFLPEVVAEGEWSALFFDGKLSHCVIKRPRAGDFRVQEAHGGKFESVAMPPTLLPVCMKFLDVITEPLLYARLDFIRRGDEYWLGEMELTEPSLYLAHADSGAPDRLTAALVSRLDNPFDRRMD